MGEPPRGQPRYCSNQTMLPAPQQLAGPFNFLGRSPDELRRLVPDADQILPAQLRIYQEDESGHAAASATRCS